MGACDRKGRAGGRAGGHELGVGVRWGVWWELLVRPDGESVSGRRRQAAQEGTGTESGWPRRQGRQPPWAGQMQGSAGPVGPASDRAGCLLRRVEGAALDTEEKRLWLASRRVGPQA